MTEPLLRVEHLDVRYGSSRALFGVSVSVAPGTVLAVLGANGAGKSTLARAVSGLVPSTSGRVFFDGEEITGQPAHRIRKLGLTYIPEGRGIFPGLSVVDNLRMAVGQEKRNERAGAIDAAIDLFPVLGARRMQRAGSLSGGEQQMLAVARILRTGARLLLLDEISEGLAPVIVDGLAATILELRRRGYTLLMVEQNFRFAAPLADRFYVMERGRMAHSFNAAELPDKMTMVHEYLGI